MGLAEIYPGINEGQTLPLKNLQGGGLLTFGSIFFVDSVTGSDTAKNGKSPTEAFATIATAIAACTANKGDTIFVLPGHVETRTAAITVNKAGVKIIGLGEGLVRPTITGNGTIDVFDITAANVTLDNFAFPAPSTDDQTSDVNISGAGVTLRNLYSIGSTTAKNKTDIITVASGADDLLVEKCFAYNTVVDCVSWLSLEAAVARPIIRDNVVQGTFSTAALMDEATATLATIQRNILKNTKAATAIVNFTNNSTGVCSFNHMSGRHTTLASNLVAGTGMDFFENRVVEEAAVNGTTIIPTVDVD
jgi:hypothetical protein